MGSVGELKGILDRMFFKGTVRRMGNDNQYKYSLAMFVVGFFEHQVDRMESSFANNVYEYFDNKFFNELGSQKIPQLRTVPIEKSIDVKHRVEPYDRILDILGRRKGPFATANCICRQVETMVKDGCKLKNAGSGCLLFGRTALHYMELGIAKEINKKEALDLVNRAMETGLVVQPVNTINPTGICFCCGCCCGLLRSAKRHPKPVQLFASNFYANLDGSKCNECKKCLKRCQMDAIIALKANFSIDLDRCIGCGVCVPTCPQKALRLEAKETLKVPYDNVKKLYLNILKSRFGLLKSLKILAKNLF